MAVNRWLGQEAEISHLDPQAPRRESRLEMSTDTPPRPRPSDFLPTVRPHLLNLTGGTNLMTKFSKDQREEVTRPAGGLTYLDHIISIRYKFTLYYYSINTVKYTFFLTDFPYIGFSLHVKAMLGLGYSAS